MTRRARGVMVWTVLAVLVLPAASAGAQMRTPRPPRTPEPVRIDRDDPTPAPQPTAPPARRAPSRSEPRSGSTSGTGTERGSSSSGGTSSGGMIRSAPTDERRIALTLDDGFRPDMDLIDLLETRGIRGTAFIVGYVAESRPELVRELVRIGWEVCSHTYSHKVLPALPSSTIREEIIEGAEAVERVAGQECRYFRPPAGLANARVVRIARELGFTVVGWNASLSDSTTPDTDPRVQVGIAMEGIAPGAILLGHFGGVHTYEVLDRVLTRLLASGYEVGTLTELFRSSSELSALARSTPTPQPRPTVEVVTDRLAAAPPTTVSSSAGPRMAWGALLALVAIAAGTGAVLTARRPRPAAAPRRPEDPAPVWEDHTARFKR